MRYYPAHFSVLSGGKKEQENSVFKLNPLPEQDHQKNRNK